jgi:hypothetical protein
MPAPRSNLRETPQGRERRCPDCRRWLPETIEHFHRNGGGHQHRCRACNCAHVSAAQKARRVKRQAAIDFANTVAAKAKTAWEALDAITERWGHV